MEDDAVDAHDPENFVRAHTTLAAVPYVPEVRLHLITCGAGGDDGVYDLWERAGRLPFWACPWAGGQALARHVLDHPEIVRGRTVLDLATGSGLVAVAAALAGAAEVVANDVDPYALAAVRLNARANRVKVRVRGGDLLDGTPSERVVLAGDVYYEEPLARRVTPFLSRARGDVLIGAPDRACSYLPDGVFEPVSVHRVPAALEDAPSKRTTIYHLYRRT
ncbi:50S ribosomal protein L11 methyltransferase [Microbispora rosea subsp. aerata]|nr:50S ribosomal protein L11 methyltransferase [Microbispora rosea]GGO10612.1 50S ribosomal protein L11 methyltransferase [Microbispora rosea subsp. aerata]GIH53690.1 50S ribosomal protein L11 methyltransferase [Microbispora rosea subsp. aerata]GLJ81683.1 50S ribosomal protein L11 methyltransferase [Microbispora rosea subsp. aerata]